MPTVPGLVPTVAPSSQGTPEFSPNVPVEAFGGAIGHALQGLGQAEEGVGDKLWQRALEIQRDKNEIAVDRADTTFMDGVAKLHADFTTKKGENAEAALQDYTKGIQKLREDTSKTLTNTESQQMFMRQSGGTMRSMIVAGATHAARELQGARIQAIDARVATYQGLAAASDDPAVVNDARAKSAALIRTKHSVLGTPDMAEDEINKGEAAFLAGHIQNVSKNDPYTAKALLETNREKLGAYYNQTQDIVTAQARSQGAQTIGQGIWAQNVDVNGPKISLGEMEAKAEEEARKKFPDDDIAALHAKNAVSARWNMYQQAKAMDQRESKNDIYGMLLSGKVQNLKDLLATPEGVAAWKTLDEVQQKGLEKEIENYVKHKADIVSKDHYAKLWNMAHSDDPKAVMEFLNTPLLSQGLNQPDLEKLTNLRIKMTKEPKADPRAIAGMGYLRDARGQALTDMGVYKRAGNEEAYDKFVGALVDAIEDYHNVNKKPPGRKEIVDEIAPALMQSHTVPRFFGQFTGKEYNYVVDEKYAQDMKDRAAEVGRTVDDRDIRRAYVHELMERYRKSKATDGTK